MARPCRVLMSRLLRPCLSYDSTDADGSYSLTVLAGTYQVEVSKTGYASPASQIVTVPPSQSSINFTFPQRYTISGAVRDFDNTPMQVCSCSKPTLAPLRFYDTRCQWPLLACRHHRHVPGQVSKTSYPSPAQQTVTVPPNQSKVYFVFPRRYTIRGVVRDYDGTPLAGVTCAASRSASRRAPMPAGATRCSCPPASTA